ncbi:MAG: 50S ribosomal protein L17 [Bifidobacteriaceae bacterium]|jgi:large subunit ribosomal protein L17|nr:50S ribosomal protein L17 [Bifidobacteriaceae bacterium]
MVKPAKGARLGSSPAHERLILANLASQLFERGVIETTLTKAKRMRPYTEKLITLAKDGSINARRQVLKSITSKSIVHKLFTEIAPKLESRPGGYLRIVKSSNRLGDNAPMAFVEIVDQPISTNPDEDLSSDDDSQELEPETETEPVTEPETESDVETNSISEEEADSSSESTPESEPETEK